MKRVSGDQVGTLVSMSIGEVGRAPDTQALSQHRSQPTWSFTRARERLCQAGQERAIVDAMDRSNWPNPQPWGICSFERSQGLQWRGQESYDS